jgi:hypothetical protein
VAAACEAEPMLTNGTAGTGRLRIFLKANLVKTEIMYIIDRAVNTLRLGYKNQSVNAV